jgi:hypothetical protein
MEDNSFGYQDKERGGKDQWCGVSVSKGEAINIIPCWWSWNPG